MRAKLYTQEGNQCGLSPLAFLILTVRIIVLVSHDTQDTARTTARTKFARTSFWGWPLVTRFVGKSSCYFCRLAASVAHLVHPTAKIALHHEVVLRFCWERCLKHYSEGGLSSCHAETCLKGGLWSWHTIMLLWRIIIWLCLTRTGNYKIHEFDWLKLILTAV